jgi:hypothetical protein
MISTLVPVAAVAGGPAFVLTVNGTNFNANGPIVRWNGGDLPTTFVSATQLNANVPANLIAQVGTASVTVLSNDSLSAPYFFPIDLRLVITTASLPSGSLGAPYYGGLAATGGRTPPNGGPPLYNWSASGLPPGLFLTAGTGAITGIPTAAGGYTVSVSVSDAGIQTVFARYTINVPAPPLQIVTGSRLLDGMVGNPYIVAFAASYGTPPYSFSLARGAALPAGLSLSASGFLTGTPTTLGQYGFSVTVTDYVGGTASRDFTLVIVPASLVITTNPPLPNIPVGSPFSIKFGASGGIPRYAFGVSGSIPPGTTMASDGTLSGTPNSAGTFAFRVTVTDSVGTSTTKEFTITVTPPVLSITTASPLGDGQVGGSYSAQFSATGGVPPYKWSASGVPAGLGCSGSGSLSGTPTADGQFSVSVTVTDSVGVQAAKSFDLTIIPLKLIITTASLPNGTAGSAYSAGLSASGGVKPYTWSVSGLPDGVTAAPDGTIGGTPKTPGKFTVSATVTDARAATAAQSFGVTIAAPPLVIITASAPNGTVGSAYSMVFAASGGVPPYTWSASGLSAGVSMASSGALSGTPTAPGTLSFTVAVKDSAGATASKTFQVTIVLPPGPSLNFAGLPDNSNPATQPRLQVTLVSAYPVDVTVTLTMTFAADSGPDDPAVQFSSGGRTARIVVAAGSTAGSTDAGVQTGTVAGTITITAQLQAAAQDVTPAPAPRRTIRINATAPVIAASPTPTATRTSSGFTVVLSGYASSRELTQAIFTFTAAVGSNLLTSSVTIPIDTLFASWYSSPASAQYGSQFTLTQPFTVQGTAQILSVTVTLVSKVGSSAPVTINLQ